MMGEIGINDYLVALMAKRTGEEVRTFVPHIVGAIRSLLAVSA
jgi:hypothetical protein